MKKVEEEQGVPPYVTEAVWDELASENPEFFIAFHRRIRVRDQLLLFSFFTKHRTRDLPSILRKPQPKPVPLQAAPFRHFPDPI